MAVEGTAEMSFLEQLLLGVYLGVVTGILPGVVAWSLAFLFKYFTQVTVPALGVMVLAVALAGIQGGLLGLLDVEGVTPLVALLVVMMIAMYCHSKGDKMGAEFPRRVTLKSLKSNRLSSDVVERIGRFGKVELEVVGEVGDVEGYPPLGDEVRQAIKEGDWTYPAESSVAELERLLAEDLVKEFDLSDVSVEVDEHGKAHVSAAPALAGLSKRVPEGKRALSFDSLVPTGVAQGDRVRLKGGAVETEATVVSARSRAESTNSTEEVQVKGDGAADAIEDVSADAPSKTTRAPTTSGGLGRLTVAVDRAAALQLLKKPPSHAEVLSRGSRREFELVSLLRGAGKQVRKVSVGRVEEGLTLADLAPRDRFEVIVLAVKSGGERALAPTGSQEILKGDELFVVGRREAIDGFVEAVK